MSDDLAALFAKKAQKRNKKKNVVNLDEVGQQLERKARIQETGELEFNENDGKETKINESSKITPSAEDSEWIEHTEKPSLVGLNFKEFTENPDELLEEEMKRANSETTKTWQIKEEAPVEPPKPVQPRAYQAPQARREAKLDITNEEMFPSIAAADVIAEKLKVEEKKKVPTPIAPPEEQFQEAKKFRPRVMEHESGGSRIGGSSYRGSDGPSRFGGGGGRPSLDSSEKREERSWRPANTTPATAPVGRGGSSSTPASSQDDGVANWRSASRVTPRADQPTRSAEASGGGCENWRSSKPAAIIETPISAAPAGKTTTPAPGSGKYVTPRMRGKT